MWKVNFQQHILARIFIVGRLTQKKNSNPQPETNDFLKFPNCRWIIDVTFCPATHYSKTNNPSGILTIIRHLRFNG